MALDGGGGGLAGGGGGRGAERGRRGRVCIHSVSRIWTHLLRWKHRADNCVFLSVFYEKTAHPHQFVRKKGRIEF